MSWELYLTNAAVGAFLGAGTNDLAIRMIFRYLIPRKKAQIADAIRDVVSTELLTPAKIVERLDDPAVRAPLRHGAAQWIDTFLNRDLPSWIALTDSKRETLGPREDALVADLLRHAFDHLASDAFREEALKPFLTEQWRQHREHAPADLSPDLTTMLHRDFPPTLSAWLASDGFRNHAVALAAQALQHTLERAATLTDLVPAAVRESIDGMLAERTPWLMDLLASALEEPAMQARLTRMVEDALRRNAEKSTGVLGGLKAFATQQLADVRGAVAHLPEAVRQTDATELAPLLKESMDRVWCRPWREVAGDFDEAKTRQLAATLVTGVLSKTTRDAVTHALTEGLSQAAQRPLTSWLDTLGSSATEEEWIDRAADWIQRTMTSPTLYDALDKRISAMLAVAKATPIGRPSRWITDTMRDEAADFIADAVTEALRDRLAGFAEQSGLWNIVRDSINQYSDRELEGLIRRIANKELVAVTWMGGVIGAIVGFAQSFIPNLLAGIQSLWQTLVS